MIEGKPLMLDDQADMWFWTLAEDIVNDFDYAIEDFLKNLA